MNVTDQTTQATTRLRWPASSWHPLFYDLAFVAVVLALSGALSASPTPDMAAWLTVTFATLWLLWFLTTLLESRRPVGGVRVTVVTVQMALLLVAAVSADDNLEDNTDLVGLLLGAALVVTLVLMRVGGAWVDARAAAALAVAAALWPLSVLLWFSWAVLVPWVIALLAMGYAAVRLLRPELPDLHRMTHRLGELTVIVIGESFLKIALVAGDAAVSEFSVLALVVAFAVGTLTWWDYFIGPEPAAGALTQGRALAWSAAHLLGHLTLIALAVGLAKLLVYGGELELALAAGLLVAPLAGFAAARALIDLALLDFGARAIGTEGPGARGPGARRDAALHTGLAVALAMLALLVWRAQWPGPIAAALAMTVALAATVIAVATRAPASASERG